MSDRNAVADDGAPPRDRNMPQGEDVVNARGGTEKWIEATALSALHGPPIRLSNEKTTWIRRDRSRSTDLHHARARRIDTFPQQSSSSSHLIPPSERTPGRLTSSRAFTNPSSPETPILRQTREDIRYSARRLSGVSHGFLLQPCRTPGPSDTPRTGPAPINRARSGAENQQVLLKLRRFWPLQLGAGLMLPGQCVGRGRGTGGFS
jgi:hypothetical protein